MSWAGRATTGRVALAYAGERAVRLSLSGTLLVSAEVSGRAAALAALSDGIRDLPRGVQLNIAVSGSTCRPFLLPEIVGATHESDWTAIASSLVEECTGLTGNCRVWLDPVRTSPRLAVAMEAEWRRELVALGGRRLRRLRPWWACAIDYAVGEPIGPHSPVKGLGVADSDALVMLMTNGNTYRVAQSYVFEAESVAAVFNRALIAHETFDGGVKLVEFDLGAQVGQLSGETLPFAKEIGQ